MVFEIETATFLREAAGFRNTVEGNLSLPDTLRRSRPGLATPVNQVPEPVEAGLEVVHATIAK